MEFRTELYNAFNHTNYYLPGAISASQGTTSAVEAIGRSVPVSAITASASTNGQITSTFTPRIIQFGLKIRY